MIIIAGFGCECVTFRPGTITLDYLRPLSLFGQDVIEKCRGTFNPIAGFINVLESENLDLLPVCDTPMRATATAADKIYDYFSDRILNAVEEAGKELEGVLLSLHGAMVTESRIDPETDLVNAVRNKVGPHLPIMVTLDLHANKDTAILDAATALFGFHTSPHVDMVETGERAARTLVRTLRGEINPVTVLKKPAIVVPSIYSVTERAPARIIMDRVREWVKRKEVIDVSALFGFSWADMPALGMSMAAVTDNNPELAEEITEDLCRLAEQHRDALTGSGDQSLFSVEDGVRYAEEKAAKGETPVVLLDHADRTRDTTFILKEFISRGIKKAAIPCLYDPEAAAACIKAGKGKSLTVRAGACSGWNDGGKVEVKVKVLWAGEGRYKGTGPLWKNMEINLGPTAIVDAHGIWIQFTSREMSLIDEDPFTAFGYNPRDFDIIVTKSKTHFRAVYEELASEIITIDAPGQTPVDLGKLKYRYLPDVTP